MDNTFRHLALFVSDLQRAEEYYQTIFGMELIGREGLKEDRLWYTLPFDKDWDDARAGDIDLGMSALRKGDIVLALFAGGTVSGQVFAIGLNMDAEEIEGVRSRLPSDTMITADGTDFLEFRDAYGIMWQLSVPGSQFKTAGEFAGRWLEL